MSVQTVIGAGEAAAILAEARAMGETITLSHRSGTAITLYALVVPLGSYDKRTGRTDNEIRRARFTIPAQTGLAYSTDDTEPIIDGDVIVWRGRNHYVKPPVLSDANGYAYVVEAEEEKALSTGPRG